MSEDIEFVVLRLQESSQPGAAHEAFIRVLQDHKDEVKRLREEQNVLLVAIQGYKAEIERLRVQLVTCGEAWQREAERANDENDRLRERWTNAFRFEGKTWLETQQEAEIERLQERLRAFEPPQGEGWPDDRTEFASRLTHLREAAERIKAERDTLQQRVKELEAEVKRLRERMASWEHRCVEVARQVKEEVERLREDNEAKDKELESYHAHVGDLHRENESLTIAADIAKRDLTQAEAGLALHIGLLEQAQQRVRELEDQK